MKNLIEINKEAYEYSLVTGDCLNQLYEPAKNYLGLDAFAYFRYLNDGSFLFFGVGDEDGRLLHKWYCLSRSNLSCENNSYRRFAQGLLINQEAFYIHPQTTSDRRHNEDVLEYVRHHNIKSMCGLLNKTHDCLEDFRFAFKQYHSPQSLLEQSSLLKAFARYLKSQFKDMLYSNKHVFCTLGNDVNLNLFQESIGIQNRKNFLDFLIRHDITMQSLKHLSPQEYECLRLMVRGKTMKNSSLILNISPRTVETYIKSIKLKTGCHFKSELIDRFFYSFYEKND